MTNRRQTSMKKAVAEHLDRLAVSPDSQVLASLALHLAGVLDSGVSPSQTAMVSRELRQCLHGLSTVNPDDDFDLWLADMRNVPGQAADN